MIALAQIDCVDSTLERRKIVAEIADSANKIGMATLARLRCVGGRSIYAIYDIEDVSV